MNCVVYRVSGFPVLDNAEKINFMLASVVIHYILFHFLPLPGRKPILTENAEKRRKQKTQKAAEKSLKSPG